MTTLADLITALERAYPPELAESWDAIGLVCGDPDQPVNRAHVCVDPVESTVDEAIAGGAQLIVAHHPLLLRGVHGVPANTPKGGVVHRLIRSGVALYCAHTNADAADPGVSDALAVALGLTVTGPLVPGPDGRTGTGRLGTLPAAEPLRAFTQRVADALPGLPPACARPATRTVRSGRSRCAGEPATASSTTPCWPVSTPTSPLTCGTIRPANTWPGRAHPPWSTWPTGPASGRGANRRPAYCAWRLAVQSTPSCPPAAPIPGPCTRPAGHAHELNNDSGGHKRESRPSGTAPASRPRRGRRRTQQDRSSASHAARAGRDRRTGERR